MCQLKRPKAIAQVPARLVPRGWNAPIMTAGASARTTIGVFRYRVLTESCPVFVHTLRILDRASTGWLLAWLSRTLFGQPPWMSLVRIARRSLSATVELALPTTCGACGASGATWCLACAQEAASAKYSGGAREVCPSPCPEGYPRTWAATPYDASVRAALVAFKDSDRRDLVMVLAPMLSSSMVAALAGDSTLREVLASGNGPVLVVPVPSSRAAVRRRGDAPLELLTREAVRQVRLSERELMFTPALRLRRRVADQAGLDHRHRADNLEHAIGVRPRWQATIQGATALLVDDVLTTGATIVEAARALTAGGVSHVAAATVAATQRRVIPD